MNQRFTGPFRSLRFVLFLGLSLSSIPANAGETPVERLPSVNWAGNDYAPSISPDSRYLIFQSDRPGSAGSSDLWMSENLNFQDRSGKTRWTVPVPARFPFTDSRNSSGLSLAGGEIIRNLNTPGFEGMPAILYQENEPVEILFTSVADDSTHRKGYDGLNLYSIRFQDHRWLAEEHLNLINGNFNDRMPALSLDGKLLLFSSDRPGGEGGYDLYMSCRTEPGQPWQKPRNLGPGINTPANEISPSISPSGRRLLFSSDRDGGQGSYDLYTVIIQPAGTFQSECDRILQKSSRPRNLGSPWNSPGDEETPVFSQDGLFLYFASDRIRSGESPKRFSSFDLFRSRVPSWLMDTGEIVFSGRVLDGSSRFPLAVEATLHIEFETETVVLNSRVEASLQDPVSGTFSVRLLTNRRYRVTVSAPGYYPLEMELDYTGNIPLKREDRREIFLMPVVPEAARKEATLGKSIQGRVVDAKTGLPLPGARVQLLREKNETENLDVNREGVFHFHTGNGESFRLIASTSGYKTLRKEYRDRSDLKEIILRLEPVEGVLCPGDDPSCLDNLRIFFGLNSSRVDGNEIKKVDTIERILRVHPELKLEIQGHADRTYLGPESRAYKYNLDLSRNRAEEIRRVLISRGIEEGRLQVKAYSYIRPWQKVEPSLNRRVEFRVIRKDRPPTESGEPGARSEKHTTEQ